MGDFPWMTERGTFIINGTERVVVTQLVRSPGAYLMEPKDAEKQVFVAQPDAGPRLLAGARDRQEGPRLRPHRPQAQAAGHGPAARDGLRHGRGDPEAASTTRSTSATRSTRTPSVTQVGGGRADRAVQEAAPGRAAVGGQRPQPAQPAVLRPEALRPHARRSLQAQLAPRPRHRPRDADPDPRRHHRPRQGARHAAEAARPARGARRGSRTTRPRRWRARASPSPTTSTSTSTSATAACARSAS